MPLLKVRSRLILIQYRVLFKGSHYVHLGLLVERAPSLTSWKLCVSLSVSHQLQWFAGRYKHESDPGINGRPNLVAFSKASCQPNELEHRLQGRVWGFPHIDHSSSNTLHVDIMDYSHGGPFTKSNHHIMDHSLTVIVYILDLGPTSASAQLA